MVLAAGAGVDTKYVLQGMRCYTLNIGHLYHAKLGHVRSESTLLPPEPFPFLTSNDWSVHHSPQTNLFKMLQGTYRNPDIISTTNQHYPSY
jgi:hypothetical protein